VDCCKTHLLLRVPPPFINAIGYFLIDPGCHGFRKDLLRFWLAWKRTLWTRRFINSRGVRDLENRGGICHLSGKFRRLSRGPPVWELGVGAPVPQHEEKPHYFYELGRLINWIWRLCDSWCSWRHWYAHTAGLVCVFCEFTSTSWKCIVFVYVALYGMSFVSISILNMQELQVRVAFSPSKHAQQCCVGVLSCNWHDAVQGSTLQHRRWLLISMGCNAHGDSTPFGENIWGIHYHGVPRQKTATPVLSISFQYIHSSISYIVLPYLV